MILQIIKLFFVSIKAFLYNVSNPLKRVSSLALFFGSLLKDFCIQYLRPFFHGTEEGTLWSSSLRQNPMEYTSVSSDSGLASFLVVEYISGAYWMYVFRFCATSLLEVHSLWYWGLWISEIVRNIISSKTKKSQLINKVLFVMSKQIIL